MAEIFSFGGYGGFIFAAYGATLLGLGGLFLLSWRGYVTAQRAAKQFKDETAQ